MAPGYKTGGRKAGTPNKIDGRQVRENIIAVFNRLDGTPGMAQWARENPTEFYKLYIKMLPLEIEATVQGVVEHLHVVVPQLTNEEWMQAHGLGTASGTAVLSDNSPSH